MPTHSTFCRRGTASAAERQSSAQAGKELNEIITLRDKERFPIELTRVFVSGKTAMFRKFHYFCNLPKPSVLVILLSLLRCIHCVRGQGLQFVELGFSLVYSGVIIRPVPVNASEPPATSATSLLSFRYEVASTCSGSRCNAPRYQEIRGF